MLRKHKWHVWCLYHLITHTVIFWIKLALVLGLRCEVLVAGGLQGWFLWAAARASHCVWWSWCHWAPGWTHHWALSHGGSASDITVLKKGLKNPPAQQAAAVTRENIWRKELIWHWGQWRMRRRCSRHQRRDFPAACSEADPPAQLRKGVPPVPSGTAGIQPGSTHRSCHDNAGIYYSSNLFIFPFHLIW